MRRSLWIVCLMLALLPLRGWAHASMALPVPDPSPAMAMPCHEGMPAAAEVEVKKNSASHACHLCALCHAAAAPLGDFSLPTFQAIGTARPSPPAAAPAHRAPGRLERPPRTVSA